MTFPDRLPGVNVDPENDAVGRGADLAAAGAGWARLVFKPAQDTAALITDYHQSGVRVFAACDADTFKLNFDPFTCAQQYLARCQSSLPDAIQIGPNEPDGAGATSTTASEQVLYTLSKAWRDVWASTGVTFVGAASVSGDPHHAVWSPRVLALYDYGAVHPYNEDAATVGLLLEKYYLAWNLRMVVTEFRWEAAFARKIQAYTDGPCFVYNWRSWKTSKAEWLDGLLDLNGSITYRYPQFKAFAKEIRDMAFTVSPQLLDKMNQKNDKPASSERYDNFGNSVCAGEKYLWTYDKQSNQTYAQPLWTTLPGK